MTSATGKAHGGLRRRVRQAYLGGVWFKGAHGAFDLVVGVIVLAAPALLPNGVLWLAEEAGDALGAPGAALVTALRSVGSDLLTWPGWLLGGFLLVHGAVKFASAYCLLRRVVRGYPWALAALIGLLIYQVVDAVVTGSVLMGLLVVVDIAVIALVVAEYRELRRGTAPAAEPAAEAPSTVAAADVLH